MSDQPVTRFLSSKAALAALALGLLSPRARAEDSLQFRHESYQEADGRIRVESQYGQAEAQLPAEVRLRLSGVIDSISGATPTGELDRSRPENPVVLSTMRDRRKAWHAELSRPFGSTALTLGFDNSRESDYLSNAVSINTATDFNQKNTTLLAGFALTRDDVQAVAGQPRRSKEVQDAMIGLTQLIDARTSVTLNLTYGRAAGFLNDPYKLVARTNEVLPGIFQYLTFAESRPGERQKGIANVLVNRAVPEWGGALEANYRFYHDTFGINSHTATLSWFQSLAGGRVLLIPSVRWYQQTAAHFYYADLDRTSIIPESSPGLLYSSDYRLAKMATSDLGLKVVWKVIADRLSLDASYHRYALHGRDDQTASTAFPTANIYTVGARVSW